MTESLQMAIERLLEALDADAGEAPGAGGAFAILRARLAADVSDALAHDGGTVALSAETLSDAELAHELAAYLEGHLSQEERARFIGLLAREPDALGALESAAAFLDDLQPHTTEVSPALMAEAMAAFAPNAVEPVAAAAAAAPAPEPVFGRSRLNRRNPDRFDWRMFGALAATLLVGVVGGVQLWHAAGPSGEAPAGVNATTQRQSAPAVSQPATPAPPALSSETSRAHAPDAVNHLTPLTKSVSDCDAASPPSAAPQASVLATGDKNASRGESAGKPCRPPTANPTGAAPLPVPAAKPDEQKPLGSPY